MASQTELKILLSKGPLTALWSNKALKTNSNITINNGQLYIGLGDDGRAMLFIDDDGMRHPFTADVAWGDIRNLPTDLALTSDIAQLKTTLTNQIDTKVSKAGDTMTGKLTANQGLECTDINWVPSGNINCVPTANNNEWSFDIHDSTYTNAMWHIYSLKAQSSILQCIADPEYKVNIPHGKLGLGSANFKYNTSDKCIDVIFT